MGEQPEADPESQRRRELSLRHDHVIRGRHLPGDAVDRHALAQGRLNVLIELRNDLIADEAGQRHWAERLAPILAAVLAEVEETTDG